MTATSRGGSAASRFLSSLAASKWTFLLPKIATWIFVALAAIRYSGGLYAFVTENRLEQPSYRVVARLADGVEVRHYEPYNVAGGRFCPASLSFPSVATVFCGQVRSIFAYGQRVLPIPLPVLTCAEATIKASFKDATSNGFRLCAAYLFGKNSPRASSGFFFRKPLPDNVAGEKMEMTAPVRQKLLPNKRVKVSFVMPRKRTLGSLPIPRDSKVQLRAVPAHYAAFKRFNGPPPSDATVAKKEAIVRKALAASGGAIRPVPGTETLVYGFHDPFLVPNLLRRNEVGLAVTVATPTGTGVAPAA